MPSFERSVPYRKHTSARAVRERQYENNLFILLLISLRYYFISLLLYTRLEPRSIYAVTQVRRVPVYFFEFILFVHSVRVVVDMRPVAELRPSYRVQMHMMQQRQQQQQQHQHHNHQQQLGSEYDEQPVSRTYQYRKVIIEILKIYNYYNMIREAQRFLFVIKRGRVVISRL